MIAGEKMKKTVLLYNFTEERLQGVQRALVPLKALAKAVPHEQFGCKLGFLVGEDGFDGSADGYEPFVDELLVMYGFDSGDIDMLIRSLRKYGVGRVELKAVVTPTNINWNGSELYFAVKADHEEMKKLREQKNNGQ